MAITSPSLVLSLEALWGNITPKLDALKKLGSTDFSKEKPGVDVKPGATIKIPVSSVTAASAFNTSSNNYLTGGTTTWAQLTAAHYLQGFDISGANLDEGIDAPRMKQLFAVRAGLGISAAIQAAVKTALDSATQSTGVTLGTIGAQTGAPTLADYMGLADGVTVIDKSQSVLAVNGALLADIKAKFAAINVAGTLTELAQFMGFADMVLVPGMTARACIVPAGSFGSLGRVPQLIASYRESGVETDENSGLSIGIVVADDQSTNRVIVNADLWFGCAIQSANAAATTAGIIKVA